MAPFLPERTAQPIDLLQHGVAGGGWEALEDMFKPHLSDAPLQPSDEVAVFLLGMFREPRGREVLEWLMDITLRAPLRVTGRTLEETALMAATRQGINGVGEAVLAAIGHGAAILEKSKQQTGEGA